MDSPSHDINSLLCQQCVFQVDKEEGELTLTELAEGVSVQDVISATACTFQVADDLKPMGQVEVDE